MKYCEDYSALLDLYVDGELSPEEMARVQSHLDECPACQSYVDDVLAMRLAFPTPEDTRVPDGFAEIVMAAIQSDTGSKARRKTHWHKVLVSLAACCALVILLQSTPLPEPPHLPAERVIVEDLEVAAQRDSAPPKSDAQEDAAQPAPRQSTSTAPYVLAPADDPPEAPPSPSPAPQQPAPPESSPQKTIRTQQPAAAQQPAAVNLTDDPHRATVRLPAEGAALISDYTPVWESETETHYRLTAQEAEALLTRLNETGCPYQQEEGADPAAPMILVILAK